MRPYLERGSSQRRSSKNGAIKVGPQSRMSGVLTKGRNLDTQTGETLCEDEGRKWRDTPTSQGTQRLLQPPEAWRQAENRLPFPALRRNPLHQHSEFRLLRPRTVRPYISVFYALRSVGLSYRRHTLNCTQKGLFVFSKPCSIVLPFPNLFGVTFLSHMPTEFLMIIHDQHIGDFHVNSAKSLAGIIYYL